MNLKDVLLKGLSFKAILSQFAIDQQDVTILDEEIVMAKKERTTGPIFTERISIEGRAANGPVINFFGTLHYNLLDQLAVFEPDHIETRPALA